jgi:TonB-linked SusC/RagA family outer membrane protein
MKRITSLLVCLLLFGSFAIFGQNIQIKGTVTSADDGSTLPGAYVKIKGTNTGTSTDANGKYEVSVPSDATLVFSLIGMKSLEVPVNARTVVDVVLESETTEVEEVIVSAVAGSTPKKKLSVSVSKVGAEELEIAPATSASSALQGKIAGITVISSSGNPGQSAGIRLRGSTSITGSQSPLVLIDGVIFEGELADVNVDDIASYEVVKGASASALYGSRAGAGVIVITSKRGNTVGEGKTEIKFRNEFGFQQLANKIDLATHHAYRLADDYQSVNTYTKYYGVTYPAGYAGGPSSEIIGSRVLDFDGYMDNPYGVLYNYQDQIFTKGQYYTNYISIANNVGKTKVFLSFENNRNQGIVWSTDGSRRQNFRINVDHNITDKLKISSSTLVTRSKIDMPEAREASEYGGDEAYGGGQGTAFFNMLFMEPDVNLNRDSPSTFLLKKYYYLPNPWSQEIENPKHALYYEKRGYQRNGIIQNLTATYNITKWVSAEASYSFDRRESTFNRIRPRGYQEQSLIFLDGQLYKYSYNGLSQTFQGTLNFNKQFGIVLAKAKLAYLYENRKEDSFNATGNGLAAANITTLDGVTGTKSISSYEDQEIARNYFGILDLDIKDRYLTSFLYRYDGSSLFGANNRWNPYYRISAAYRISEDIKIPGIQELKIRGAIGTSGQRPGFSYQYETYYLINGVIGKSTIGNKNLKPSETLEKEIGLNADFLRYFSLEVIASQNETKDAFVAVPLSASTGYSAQWRNAATLQGKSIEASLGINKLNVSKVGLHFNFTIDKVTQKVKKLDAPPFQVGPGANEVSAFYLRNGETFGIMYGNSWVTSLKQMANQLPVGKTIADYTVNSDGYVIAQGTEGTFYEAPISLDQNNDATKDVLKIADMNPKFNLAFTTTITWKNLSASMLWHWKQGGDIYNVTKQWLYRDSRSGEQDMYGKAENEKKNFSYFQALYSANDVNSHFVEDGTFLKLRELSIYYTIHEKAFTTLKVPFIKGLKIGAIGHNMLTFTKYTGWDPEVSAGGDLTNYAMDIFNYPNFRTITFSCEFTF